MLLFPSDEFGAQEIAAEKIPAFVEKQGLSLAPGSGVTLMAKVHVNGPMTDPLWKVLKTTFPGEVGWNFSAVFLVDKVGRPAGRFTGRELSKVGRTIEQLLAEDP